MCHAMHSGTVQYAGGHISVKQKI